MDRLLKEARGRDSTTKAFDETQVTKIVCEEDEVMVLKLKDKRLEQVWRLMQWPSKRRTSQLVIPIRRGGARSEGGLVVAGVTNQREGRAIVQGDLVIEQMEEKGLWVTEGNIKEVCAGDDASSGLCSTASTGRPADSTRGSPGSPPR